MFNNASITPVKKGKPHIVLVDNYWRVSRMPKPYFKHTELYGLAHGFVARLNAERHSK